MNTKRTTLVLAVLLWAAAASLAVPAAWAAPTLTTLTTFIGTNGSHPDAGLVADTAGNLYGTTYDGGAIAGYGYGTVFKLDAGTHALTTLTSFTGDNGEGPVASLIADVAGNLYGTTFYGGSIGDGFNGGFGTVFKLAVGTNALSVLASFKYSDTNGAGPDAGLIADSAGNLYGTTTYGGGGIGNGYGTVFKVAAGTNALTSVVNFNGTNGANPYAGLIADSAGNLYGTTVGGGTNNKGTVFKLTAGTFALTTLASFNGANGEAPFAALTADSAGNLYGTTERGGTSSQGTVFKLTAGTNMFTTLATFTNPTVGANPYGGLIADAAGNLYGTTYVGANGGGTVFKLDAGTNTLTTLVEFDLTNGYHPYGGLIADAAGNLYGTTERGGNLGDGTVFELTDSGFVTSVPEPSTFVLAGLGFLSLLTCARRSRSVVLTGLGLVRGFLASDAVDSIP